MDQNPARPVPAADDVPQSAAKHKGQFDKMSNLPDLDSGCVAIVAADMTASGMLSLVGNAGLANQPCPENPLAFNPTHQVHLCTGHIPAHPLDEGAMVSRISSMVFPLKYRDAIASGHSSTSDRL